MALSNLDQLSVLHGLNITEQAARAGIRDVWITDNVQNYCLVGHQEHSAQMHRNT